MAEKTLKLKNKPARQNAPTEPTLKRQKMFEWTEAEQRELSIQALQNGFKEVKSYIEALVDLHIKNPEIYKKYA